MFVSVHAAAVEPRLAAVVADAPILDMHALATAELPPALEQPARDQAPSGRQQRAASANPFAALVMERVCWQFGVASPVEWLELTRTVTNDALVERIACPVLALVGEGESAEPHRQAQRFMELLRSPGRLREFTVEEGAEAHCQLNNPSMMQETILDWLDETL